MTDSNQFDRLVEEIAARVQRRLSAAQVGVEQPCTPSPAAAPVVPKDCAPSCDACAVKEACGSRALMTLGVQRLSPADGLRTSADIARYIDHTLLKPDATREEVVKLCEEARKHGFATVCLNTTNIALAARLLAGCPTVPIAVVGFPLGAAVTNAKAFEAREAVRQGAREIDMVINIGALKSRDYALVLEDIAAVVRAARPSPVKVILETAQLDNEQKVIGCALSKAAGAAFVKTSTGFGGGGATAEDVALMRSVVGEDMGVKASGGIRTTADAQRMIAAGADRIGASASVAIVTGGAGSKGY